jgi:hypothetical protein
MYSRLINNLKYPVLIGIGAYGISRFINPVFMQSQNNKSNNHGPDNHVPDNHGPDNHDPNNFYNGEDISCAVFYSPKYMTPEEQNEHYTNLLKKYFDISVQCSNISMTRHIIDTDTSTVQVCNDISKKDVDIANEAVSFIFRNQGWNNIPEGEKTEDFYKFCLDNNVLDGLCFRTDQQIISRILRLNQCTLSELYEYMKKGIITFDTIEKNYNNGLFSEELYIYGIENKHITLTGVPTHHMTENIILAIIRTFTDADYFEDFVMGYEYNISYIMYHIPKHLRTYDFYLKVFETIKPENIKYMNELTLRNIPSYILLNKDFLPVIEKIYQNNPKILPGSVRKYNESFKTLMYIYISQRDYGRFPLDGMFRLVSYMTN